MKSHESSSHWGGAYTTYATVNLFPVDVCDGGGSCMYLAETGSILLEHNFTVSFFLFGFFVCLFEYEEWEQCLTDGDGCCVGPCFMIQIEHFASVLSPLSCGHTRNLPRIKKINIKKTPKTSSTCFCYVVVLFGGFAFSLNLAFYTFLASVTKICVFVHCKYFLDMSCINYVTNIFSKTNMIYCSAIIISLSQFWMPSPWRNAPCVVSRAPCCGTTGTAPEDWPLLCTPATGSRSLTALAIEAEGWWAARWLTLRTDCCWWRCSLRWSAVRMSWATTLHQRKDH